MLNNHQFFPGQNNKGLLLGIIAGLKLSFALQVDTMTMLERNIGLSEEAQDIMKLIIFGVTILSFIRPNHPIGNFVIGFIFGATLGLDTLRAFSHFLVTSLSQPNNNYNYQHPQP